MSRIFTRAQFYDLVWSKPMTHLEGVRAVGRGAPQDLPQARHPQPAAWPDRALIAGLRRAHAELVKRGIVMADIRSRIEDAKGMGDPYLRKLSCLAFLAPDIQRAILEGRQPAGLTLHGLLARDIPLDWEDQRQLLGFG